MNQDIYNLLNENIVNILQKILKMSCYHSHDENLNETYIEDYRRLCDYYYNLKLNI